MHELNTHCPDDCTIPYLETYLLNNLHKQPPGAALLISLIALGKYFCLISALENFNATLRQ